MALDTRKQTKTLVSCSSLHVRGTPAVGEKKSFCVPFFKKDGGEFGAWPRGVLPRDLLQRGGTPLSLGLNVSPKGARSK